MPRTSFTLHRRGPDGRVERLDVGDRLVVGREMLNPGEARDRYISSRHAVFEVRGEELHVRDLGSTNGTFVRIEGEIELRPGDVFAVGRQLFRFLA